MTVRSLLLLLLYEVLLLVLLLLLERIVLSLVNDGVTLPLSLSVCSSSELR